MILIAVDKLKCFWAVWWSLDREGAGAVIKASHDGVHGDVFKPHQGIRSILRFGEFVELCVGEAGIEHATPEGLGLAFGPALAKASGDEIPIHAFVAFGPRRITIANRKNAVEKPLKALVTCCNIGASEAGEVIG